METISKQKLKAAMIDTGIGVNALSATTGITQCLISKFLKDDFSSVRLPTLSKLCKALDVSPESLLSEET